jgi:hypothetical protein
MKRTIAKLASAIIDLAGDIGTEAQALGDADSIAAARSGVLLLKAQKAMNRARDAIRVAVQENSPNCKDTT